MTTPELILALIAALAVFPLFSPWSTVILTVALCEGLAALGIMVLLRAGQVSFGHGLFFSFSAYAVAFMAAARLGHEALILIPVATAASATVGSATEPTRPTSRSPSSTACTSTPTTDAPSASSRSTVAFPIPDAAPVTSTTFPSKRSTRRKLERVLVGAPIRAQDGRRSCRREP